jgi:hypothetical protein
VTQRWDRHEDENTKAKKGKEIRTNEMTESVRAQAYREADGQRQNEITRGQERGMGPLDCLPLTRPGDSRGFKYAWGR